MTTKEALERGRLWLSVIAGDGYAEREDAEALAVLRAALAYKSKEK